MYQKEECVKISYLTLNVNETVELLTQILDW